MVLSLNGIPIIAIELKNQLTGTKPRKLQKQWREDREPKEFLFHFNNRILAYFGADLYEVALATILKKEKTFFIPFNQGSNGAGNVGGAGNPARSDDGYVTAYLWENVLKREMFLAILQRYSSRRGETLYHCRQTRQGRKKLPRSLQNNLPSLPPIRCRRKISGRHRQVVREQIILYSTRQVQVSQTSIAWLTYRLAALHNRWQKNVFNTVFVITDRRVLNKQLQDTTSLGFDHIDGQIETITDNDKSSILKDVINNDNTLVS